MGAGIRRSLRAALAGSLVFGGVVVGSVVGGSLPASATPTLLYAAVTALGTTDCSTPANACTLGAALGSVAAGGTIELITSATDDASGNVTTGSAYPGNLTVATGGTSATSPVTIEPYGTTTPILDGGNSGSVLTVNSGVYLTISGVTIQHGSGNGGGIDNFGTATVTDITLSGNSAIGQGGGIDNEGTATVTDSTLSGNRAGDGGGIYNQGSASVTDSTLSGNSAYYYGGGILNGGTATVTDITLSGNSAPLGGGGITNGGTLNLGATIVANSPSGGDCYTFSGIADQGYNIADDGSCAFTAMGSINSSATLGASLGALATNGGPTDTMLPALGSPAIGVIPLSPATSFCPRTDQRGVASFGNCTIGAVEGGFLITTTSLPNAAVGTGYGPVTLTTQEAGMSTSPYVTKIKWTGAQLPKGMKLSSAGVLSGTPNKKLFPGAYTVVAQVTETVITLNGNKKVKTPGTVQARIPLTIT